MRGQKTVVLSGDFQFSENGQYQTTNEVLLTAPGVGKIHVHSTMHAYVMDALFSVAKRSVELKGLAAARSDAEEEESQSDVPEPTGSDVYNQIALGLGVERFPDFFAYVKKSLTNQPALAQVGANKTPITDETWESIEQSCGMEGIEEIVGSFAGFFVKSPTQAKRNGKSKSPTSSQALKEASTTGSRTASRSKN